MSCTIRQEVIMKPFKYRKLYTLSHDIREHHYHNGTDPLPHLHAMHDILQHSNIVANNNCNRTMMQHLTMLKRKYPQYMDFFVWFQHTYATHHPFATTINEETDHIALDIMDAHSVTNDSVDSSHYNSTTSPARKRWWLLYLA